MLLDLNKIRCLKRILLDIKRLCINVPRVGRLTDLGISALEASTCIFCNVSRAGSPREINVPRVGSPRDINVSGAGSPRDINVPRAGRDSANITTNN